jgi:hypothetical protein
MSSLADLPELVGFFSYSREDDEAFAGALSVLRDAIQRELSAQLGRSKTNFRLWQDQIAIAPGKLWETEIKKAVENAVFFIPIVTPRAVNSQYCKFEFEAFLAREQELGRADLVFPLLYIRVPALESEEQWRTHPVLSIIGMRQYVDWRPMRHLDVRMPVVLEQIERFCDKIVETLRGTWVSPEERLKQQEIEAQQRAEEEHRAVVVQRAEEEKQRVEAILAYLNQHGFQMASFQRLRRGINKLLTDQQFEDLIQRHPTIFRRARLSGNRPGVAKRIR